MAESENRPINVGEAAEYLGITKSSLYKLTSKGKITHYKPGGGKIYFYRSDLDEYARRGKVVADFVLDEQAADIAAGMCA